MDFTNPPHGLAQWMICLGCFFLIANEGQKFFKGMKGREPNPSNESLNITYAALHEKITNVEKRLDNLEKATSEEDRRLLKILMDFVVSIEHAVGRLEGKMK